MSTNQKVTPLRRADVIVRELEQEILILDGKSGKVHQLNATAGFVWDHCDGTQSLDDIASRLAVEYTLPASQVTADVEKIIRTFSELGLLSGRTI